MFLPFASEENLKQTCMECSSIRHWQANELDFGERARQIEDDACNNTKKDTRDRLINIGYECLCQGEGSLLRDRESEDDRCFRLAFRSRSMPAAFKDAVRWSWPPWQRLSNRKGISQIHLLSSGSWRTWAWPVYKSSAAPGCSSGYRPRALIDT